MSSTIIEDNDQQPSSPRFASLDALRGLTIMLMILVNNPGTWSHVYGPLRHAEWHGCTPTDLVFPFFLFIIGSAMCFSMSKVDEQSKGRVIFRIVKRTILIFLIGTVLHVLSSHVYNSNFRIMGVLQRIALAYGAAALIVLFAKSRTLVFAISAILLLAYWVILIAFGGDDPYSVESNVVRKIDLFVLGAKQMYSVKGIPFDPEGLLSTIPSIASVLLGFEATRFLRAGTSRIRSVLVLGAIGLACVGIGWGWGHVWPVNKALWTGSFVLLTTGWALVVLAALVWLMDIQGFKFQPLQAFGMNPLFIYVFSSVWMLSYSWIAYGDGKIGQPIFEFFLSGDEPTKASSFLYAISHVGLFWIFAAILYWKKIVIKV